MTHVLHPPPSPARELRRRVLGAAVTALLVTGGLAAAAGALVSPRASLIFGLVAGPAAAAFTAMLHRCADADLPPLPHPAVAGLAVGCVPAAVVGTSLLGMETATAAALALLLAALAGVHWLTTDLPQPRGAVPVADEDSLRGLLRTLPGELLFDEWRTADPAAPAGLRLRELLVEEMRRRDPVGTARWLAEAPGDPPHRHVRADADPPA